MASAAAAARRATATLHLERVPPGRARLALLAQDDDKAGAVRIRVSLNGKAIFTGPNPFRQRGWSRGHFPIPDGLLRPGENVVRFATLAPSRAGDQGWFMLAECSVLFE